MTTKMQIDDKLVDNAVKLGKHNTKKAAVNKALSDYVHKLEQENIISLFGSVEYDPDYDYKTQRSKA